MRDRVYLDWNATTPLRPEARAAMAAALDLPGNPSSVHAEGRAARRIVEEARAEVANAVGADARNVVFTSGGTEANSLALIPGRRTNFGSAADRLIVSAIEHASVLGGGRFAHAAVEIASVDQRGVVDLARLREMLAHGPPALVSIMSANNETGALQPVAGIADLVREANGMLHVDAIQSVGKVPFNINELNADLVSLSAHKAGGPKGVGALVIGERLERLDALITGGGQEQGRRAGTENVAGIAGFGAAIKAAMASIEDDMKRIENLRNRLENSLRRTRGVIVFSQAAPRLPNTTLFT